MFTADSQTLVCDRCGRTFRADVAGSSSAWFFDETSIDFCGADCRREAFERGGRLIGDRTVLLLGRRTPAEWLTGTGRRQAGTVESPDAEIVMGGSRSTKRH